MGTTMRKWTMTMMIMETMETTKITGGMRMTTAKMMENNKTKMNTAKATTGGKKMNTVVMKVTIGGMKTTMARMMKKRTGGKTNTVTMARMKSNKTMDKTQQTTGGSDPILKDTEN